MEEALIQDSVGKRCTVNSGTNEFLFIGKVKSFDPASKNLFVEQEQSDRTILRGSAAGMEIKLQIKPRRAGEDLVMMEGVIAQTLENGLIVCMQSAIAKKESRDSFRQNVLREAEVSKVNSREVEDPCIILDVSATGIAIQSRARYQKGDVLFLRGQKFRENGPSHTFSFQIMRVGAMRNGDSLYGGTFVRLSTEEEDKLFADIFALQAADLSAKRSE